MRYSPNGLIVNDPALLPVIYNRRANKTDFYAPVFDTHSTFTRKDYREHVASRKAISHAVGFLAFFPYRIFLRVSLAYDNLQTVFGDEYSLIRAPS